jgi:hypothetical protein
MDALSKTDLTKAELKRFGSSLYPAKAVADVAELKELLDCCFFHYGDDDNGDADDDEQWGDRDEQWKNFSAYCRKVGGFSWLNALHAFGGEDGNKDAVLDTPLTYVISTNSDDWRFVGFLLTLGVDVNARNSEGKPPLYLFIAEDSMMRRYRTFPMLMESGANDKANYQGKTMVKWANLFRDNDQVSEMIWDYFKTKHGIPNNYFNKKKGGKKGESGSAMEDESSYSDEERNSGSGLEDESSYSDENSDLGDT